MKPGLARDSAIAGLQIVLVVLASLLVFYLFR